MSVLGNHKNISSLQEKAVYFRPLGGYSQGEVFLPLLWAIPVDNLLDNLSWQGVDFQCYSDYLFIINTKKVRRDDLQYFFTSPKYAINFDKQPWPG